ncbi:MAG: HAMP domain-containing protein [Chloroflexi bacterium]|nr:HAMP domain-containing protein [Chloroflexota bacterium]
MMTLKQHTLWNTLWTWAGRVSLRQKIMGIIVAPLLILGFTIAWWVSSQLGGWLSYLLSEERVAQAMSVGLRSVVIITVFSALAGIGIGSFLTWLLTRPILDMTFVARHVRDGDLSVRAPVWANDEIGELGRAFNDMIASLDTSHRELERSNEMRAQLLHKVVSAQEDERQRISRELHDETGQALTSLLVQLKILDNCTTLEEAQVQVAGIRQLTQRTLHEVRRLAADLRPAALDDLGLISALEGYIDNYASKSGLQVDFQPRGMEQERLPRDMEIVLYRVIQESLTNILRHANAKTVSVIVERQPAQLHLSIVDDGCGFDIESVRSAKNRGLGLLGMQERIELLGGTLTLASEPGRGTRLEVVLLLPDIVGTGAETW